MTTRHIWFDPGNITGYALFEADTPVEMGTLEYPYELYHWLTYNFPQNVDLVGYENFRLNPRGAKYGYTPDYSEVIAARVIGAIELAAFDLSPNLTVVSQEPDIKPVGYGMAGLKYVKGKKGVHMNDAIAHGAYWWHMTHVAKRNAVK